MLLNKRDQLERASLSASSDSGRISADDIGTADISGAHDAVPASPRREDVPHAEAPAPGNFANSRADMTAIRETLSAEPEEEGEATPAWLLNRLFTEAVRLDASDIHIIPEKQYLSVRFRLNGVFHEVAEWDINLHDTILSRLKVIAGMQVVEKNIPQDGHLEIMLEAEPRRGERGEPERSFVEFNFRVSTMPTVNGEAAVLRALNRDKALLSFEEIGLSERSRDLVKKIIRRGHGIFLVTGHSGSGKTTALYSVLNFLNSAEKAILTLEDPVEYRMDNVRQSQVAEHVGFTFEAGLKAMLRQDPDVVMVGEIRDVTTSETAMRLALAGRLVLTTFHASSVSNALVRFTEMDIERSIVSSALAGIVATRLVRKICDTCRVEAEPPYALLKLFGIEWTGEKVYAGRGCDACLHTGYRGRTGIFEILEVDDEFRNMIIKQAMPENIEKYLKAKIPETLLSDGFNKVRRGVTTLEEVVQAVI